MTSIAKTGSVKCKISERAKTSSSQPATNLHWHIVRHTAQNAEVLSATRSTKFIEESVDDNYVIDLNYAYNPYCGYSDDYVGPLPPKENWLVVRIISGEMTYHD